MRRILPLIALLSLACSTAITTSPDEEVTVDGPLRLAVSDAPAMMGVMYALPNVTTDRSTVIVTNTRYGSLCATAITGHADVTATTVTLRITYAERLTSCVAGVRAISYRAEVSGLTGKAYEVRVVHEENGQSNTLVTRSVTLP